MPIAIIAVVVIALIGAGAVFLTSNEAPSTTDTSNTEIARTETVTPTETAVSEPETTGSTDAENTDSTPYTTTVTYLTPARTSHEMDITLTVDTDGTIVDAAIVYDNGDGFSNPHQARFDAAYRDLVIGQTLDAVELAAVGGASLTSGAFNEAVAEIESQRS